MLRPLLALTQKELLLYLLALTLMSAQQLIPFPIAELSRLVQQIQIALNRPDTVTQQMVFVPTAPMKLHAIHQEELLNAQPVALRAVFAQLILRALLLMPLPMNAVLELTALQLLHARPIAQQHQTVPFKIRFAKT
jgi:hypothetical protein